VAAVAAGDVVGETLVIRCAIVAAAFPDARGFDQHWKGSALSPSQLKKSELSACQELPTFVVACWVVAGTEENVAEVGDGDSVAVSVAIFVGGRLAAVVLVVVVVIALDVSCVDLSGCASSWLLPTVARR
jgi:hypothetical protein